MDHAHNVSVVHHQIMLMLLTGVHNIQDGIKLIANALLNTRAVEMLMLNSITLMVQMMSVFGKLTQ